MDQAIRNDLWDQYFEAEFRSRYFARLSGRLRAVANSIAFTMALLSSAALANSIAGLGWSGSASVLGLLSAVLGIYSGTSGFPLQIATAMSAQTAWNKAAITYRMLWGRCQAGEDVTAEFRVVVESMEAVDAMVIRSLSDKKPLIDRAWEDTKKALAARPVAT